MLVVGFWGFGGSVCVGSLGFGGLCGMFLLSVVWVLCGQELVGAGPYA